MSDEKRQIPCDFIHMWNLKNKINEQTKRKHTRRYKEQSDGCHMGGELGAGWKRERN